MLMQLLLGYNTGFLRNEYLMHDLLVLLFWTQAVQQPQYLKSFKHVLSWCLPYNISWVNVRSVSLLQSNCKPDYYYHYNWVLPQYFLKVSFSTRQSEDESFVVSSLYVCLVKMWFRVIGHLIKELEGTKWGCYLALERAGGPHDTVRQWLDPIKLQNIQGD